MLSPPRGGFAYHVPVLEQILNEFVPDAEAPEGQDAGYGPRVLPLTNLADAPQRLELPLAAVSLDGRAAQ